MINQLLKIKNITVSLLSVLGLTSLILFGMDYLYAKFSKTAYHPLKIACGCIFEVEYLFVVNYYLQTYFNKHGHFPTTNQELNKAIAYQNDGLVSSYNYRIESDNNRFFTYATPQSKSTERKSYISGMFIVSEKSVDANSPSKNLTTMKIICETENDMIGKVPLPMHSNGELYCGEGTKKVQSRKHL